MFKKYFHRVSTELNRDKSPLKNSLFVITLYLIIGILWIFFSDLFLKLFVKDIEKLDELQTLKGILYVLITGLMFYLIIKKRMDLYADTIDELRISITELEKTNHTLSVLESQLYDLAYYDELTGLLSRNMIARKVLEHIEHSPNDILGFVYLDIDDFKHVNELKGHDVGDQLLIQIANELKEIAGEPHIVGRLGGDEFVVILKNNLHRDLLLDMIKSHASKIHKSFILDGDEYFVSVSAGVASYPHDGKDYKTLLKCADMALSIAKQRGKNQIILYSEVFGSELQKQTDLSNLLNHSITKKELVVYYQPIYNLESNKVRSVEALIRWNHPTRGLIPPMEFIPVAERTGFIKDITWFVLKESLSQIRAWEKEGYDMMISVNLSARVLNDASFLSKLKRVVAEHKILTHKCIFEITESSILEHIEESIITLNELRAMGFKLSLDDFGTGYSSLTYLQRLPLHVVKIDRGFTRQVKFDNDQNPLIKYTIELAHALGLKVVVEGVEEVYQLKALKSMNADFIQGYHIARPSLPDELDKTLFKKTENPS